MSKFNRKFARAQWRKSLENQSKFPPAPRRNTKGAFGINSHWTDWRIAQTISGS